MSILYTALVNIKYNHISEVYHNRQTKPRLKNHILTQIINPVNPTHLYNFILEDTHITNDVLYSTPSSRLCIDIIIHLYSTTGYAIIKELTEEQTMRVTEYVTADTMICRLKIIHYKDIKNVYLAQHPPVLFVVYIIQTGYY